MTPKEKTKFKDQAQVRSMTLSATAERKKIESDCYVEGYAARYDKYLLYDDGDWGKAYEAFDPHCFDETDMSDIIMQYDHQGRVFARNTNGSLIVQPDAAGLAIAADLSRTELARQLYEDIQAGMITKMSWRFRVGDYRIERVEGSKDCTIVHTKIPKIYDVSAVSIPANDNTEINARDFVHGVMDKITRREAELEARRRALRLKIQIQEELKK